MGIPMRQTICLVLSFSILFYGCADNFHHSDHCDEFSADRVNLTPQERNHYIPVLTPTTDVLCECYCYTEDAVIITGFVVLFGGIIVLMSMQEGTYYP